MASTEQPTSILRPLVEDLHERRAKAKLGGGQEKIDKQHEREKLTARERLALLIDEGERELLERSPATVIGPTLETLVALQNALDGSPTYVHLDCDVLDPEFMPAEFPAPGGITEEKLYDLLDAVADACEVVGVEVTALSAPERAPRIAELIDPLLPKDTDGID